jgi:regulator of sirC expression with transglutaminase-like and TPR domain
MDFKLEAPTTLGYFASLVQSDAHFPLLEAAASLAQDEYPDQDIEGVLDEVDVLIQRIKQRLPSDAGALHKLRMLNKFFFEELGFAGNRNNYYDPHNSFLAEVLRTRVGIPISLAVLWLELAQSIGLDAKGVGFPGHFLVKVRLPYPHEGHVVIDPFNGESLDKEDLQERLAPLFAETGLLRDGDAVSDDLLAHYLRSATPREIVARMLRNLEEIYVSERDSVRLTLVRQRLMVLLPVDAEDDEDSPNSESLDD